MAAHAELEKRRTVLETKLLEMHTALSVAKQKLEDLETERDLITDHSDKLAENIKFLREEAQVVKLKEFKNAVEAQTQVLFSFYNVSVQIDELHVEIRRGLKQADVWIEEVKSITELLAQEAKVYIFPNDRRRDQDTD